MSLHAFVLPHTIFHPVSSSQSKKLTHCVLAGIHTNWVGLVYVDCVDNQWSQQKQSLKINEVSIKVGNPTLGKAVSHFYRGKLQGQYENGILVNAQL